MLKFAGHETFTFRYGWLKKAVDGISSDPLLFRQDDAITKLGVGKNMVESIKHWALATQIIIENKKRELGLSTLGESLFMEWDPYLEDSASLWLLHYLLVTNPGKAAVWYLAFNHYQRPVFTKQQLLEHIKNYAIRCNNKVKDNTISRDIDCFIRTYLPPKKGKSSHPEETFSCPLNELELLKQLRDGESYQFNIGPKSSLPAEIVGYVLLRFMKEAQSKKSIISISDCTYGNGSPGQVFKLDENTVVEYIEAIQLITSGTIQLDDTTGLKQVYAKDHNLAEELLLSYYNQ